MKSIHAVVALIVFGALTASAQESAPTPVFEAGVNFSLLNSHPGGGASSFYSQGGSATLIYNFNSRFSAVADLGAYHNTSDSNNAPVTFSYLFGPRVSFRKSRFTPYVQGLFGGARQWSYLTPGTGGGTAQNGFAMAFGGGVDFRLNQHWMLKPGQVEYVYTQLPNTLSTNGSQNNIRYSAGVVFTFGSKS
jgi:hypothetical protein